MTLEEAAAVFRARGLVVQVHQDRISAAAQPREPPAEFARHGVTVVYDFDLSVYRVGNEWAFRSGPPAPTEFFPDLADAVARRVRCHEEHLARCMSSSGQEENP